MRNYLPEEVLAFLFGPAEELELDIGVECSSLDGRRARPSGSGGGADILFACCCCWQLRSSMAFIWLEQNNAYTSYITFGCNTYRTTSYNKNIFYKNYNYGTVTAQEFLIKKL